MAPVVVPRLSFTTTTSTPAVSAAPRAGGPDALEAQQRAALARARSGGLDVVERTGIAARLGAEARLDRLAKVQGNCLAGGTDIALLCDIVIVTNDAKLGFPPTRAQGSPPNHMWVYHCGPQWAKRLLLTVDSILGRDAARIGLVMDSTSPERLEEVVMDLARRMSKIESSLLSANKRVVNMAMELMGVRTMQRVATEMDARAHLSPSLPEFRGNVANLGLKEALKRRDAPFGDGIAKVEAK